MKFIISLVVLMLAGFLITVYFLTGIVRYFQFLLVMKFLIININTEIVKLFYIDSWF